MEQVDKRRKKERKHPRVPIKTYKWEDVRRSRRKGGYPWTHLYKQPFNEEVDPEPFTMEALRKSKSSSTLGKKDGVEIFEISTEKYRLGASQEIQGKMNTLQIVTDPDDHSRKNSASSLVIEECDASDTASQKLDGVGLDSAESSDNISQYLDKEESGPNRTESIDQSNLLDESKETEQKSTTKNETNENPQTEEESKRKRKLSGESSRSKISLTKLAMLKKLKDAKNKIKIPKLSFPTSKLKRPLPKKATKSSPPEKKRDVEVIKKTPPEKKKDAKKSQGQRKNSKPVVIHIPLKPPPGETDEFSYLEFEEKREEKPQPRKLGSFKDVLRNLKHLKDNNDEKVQKNLDAKSPQTITEENDDITSEVTTQSKDLNQTQDANEENKENAANLTQTTNVPDVILDKDKDELKAEPNENQSIDKESKPVESDTNMDDEEETTLDTAPEPKESQEKSELSSSQENNEIDVLPSPSAKLDDDTQKIDENQNKEPNSSGENNEVVNEDKNHNEFFDKLFAVRAKKHKEEEEEESKKKEERKGRSKSEEPERKRKLSLESSYSRKSLSKLGILKKLKEASEKIKSSFSRTSSKKEISKEPEPEPEKKEVVKVQKKLKPVKPVEPVYIHIPLKPPEGQTDEFSYLEYGDKKEPLKEITEHDEKSSSLESPIIITEEVQFIILTAPSDDELLDYHSSDVPDTPSSENRKFFDNKIDDLKALAKDIVDEISPTGKQKLDPVTEETSEKLTIEEIPDTEAENINITKTSENDSQIKQTENVMVDVEDGLSESFVKKEIISDVPQNIIEDTESKQIEITTDHPEEAKTSLKEDIATDKPADEKESLKEVTTDQPIELKSSLKGDEPPAIKKKVSFKRRSKTPKDSSYEDIQIPKSETEVSKDESDQKKIPIPNLSTSQSMSVDEEKTYLDDKIVKTTSLEEDYNKWSKISDHEYEPVNPPPDDETFLPTLPTVNVVDTDKETRNLTPVTASTEISGVNTEITGKDGLNYPPQQDIDITITSSLPAPTTINDTQEVSSPTTDKSKGGPNKFQLALQHKKDQLKLKLHNIKKPKMSMPDRPKFQKPNFDKFKIEKPNFEKFKIEKPKFNLPKIPDTTKINIPTFSLTRKSSAKRSLKERQQSTEANDGDSKKHIFNFSTYPRIFKKKSKTGQMEQDIPDVATVPRSKNKKVERETRVEDRWSGSENIRIPLHSEESMDTEYKQPIDINEESQTKYDDDREDSVERRMASHIRYDEDIDIDDEYERENADIERENYLNRWDHGRFNPESNQDYLNNFRNREYKVTDLDSPDDNEIHDFNVPSNQTHDFNRNNNKENYSSGSSIGGHRIGVLEEINPDEFFLRQKGISQDDIEVGMYLSSEIREAFRMPENALSQMQDDYNNRSYDPRRISNQSLPETQNKRKPIKKPKRKKTPHTSQEKIPYAEESADDDLDLPPSRPKRRSKRYRKPKNFDDVIPYQETISVDINNTDDRLLEHRESLGILADDEREIDTHINYENEKMEGKEQPEIKITSPYRTFEFIDPRQLRDIHKEERVQEKPAAPPRKQKSLKSLNASENDLIVEDFRLNRNTSEPEMELNKIDHEYVIPESTEPPKRPFRMRSHTSSQSRGTSQVDSESLLQRSQSFTSENQIPCVEEPCIQDIRDSMGYAIIDKQKVRDPPLPPPRTPPRRKRSIKGSKNSPDDKFFTVPRSSKHEELPIRPLRNYSTLGQARRRVEPVTYENKENIDIIQYIEIEEEPNRNLQSGDIIKKMKDRPLPAPPRPPRKGRTLQDISSKENIMTESTDDFEKLPLDETEVSTQTEPLPDDFVCEDIIQEPSDRVLSPTSGIDSGVETCEERIPTIKRLITPTNYSYEETVTHGSLIVQPLDGAKILPDSEFTKVSKERIIPISPESDDETSSIPETFTKLKNPPPSSQQSFTPQSKVAEMDMLKAQKLQVTDLDVDTLTVNKLLAGKIIVSEIDSSSILTNEISSKGSALKVGEIELPATVIQEIIRTIKSSEPDTLQRPEMAGSQEEAITENKNLQQKKTSMTDLVPPEKPQQSSVPLNEINDLEIDNLQPSEHQTDLFETKIDDQLQNEPIQVPYSSDLEVLSELNEPNPLTPNLEIDSEIIVSELDNQTLKSPQTPELEPQTELENQSHSYLAEMESDELINELDNEPPPQPPPRSSNLPVQSELDTEPSQFPSNLDMEFDRLSELESEPPQPPSRSQNLESETPGGSLDNEPPSAESSYLPQRPPRQSERSRNDTSSINDEIIQEPDVDDEPPPRPPEPQLGYLPSQPPASFYALKAQKYVDTRGDNIPVVPRRRRQTKSKPVSRSSSEESSITPAPRHHFNRSPEPSIGQLTGQLIAACGSAANNSLRRLITHITNNVLKNVDGNQDLHVMMIILLVLIAGLILLGYGDEKTVVHLHHWEYFNPPRDM